MPALNDDQIAELARQQATQDALAEQGQAQPGGSFLSQFVKPAVLPTAGGIAGSAFGGGVGTPFGMTVPGGVLGGGIGSGVGEALNQLLGITEPSVGEIGKATMIPIGIGGAAAGLRTLMPFATAGKAAQVLNALAPEEAAGKVGAMMPKVPASMLFKQATAAQVTIPMNRTLHMLDNMLDDLTNVSSGVQKANSQVIGYLKGLKNKLATAPTGLSPLALQRELEGAGHVVKSVNIKGGTGSGAIKQAFEAMVDDLDDAAKLANSGSPGAQTLIAARAAFKKESFMGEVKEAIEDATKNLRGQGEFVQFNSNTVMKKIADNRFYKQAVAALAKGEQTFITQKEIDEIGGILKLLNKIPGLQPGVGVNAGSMRVGRMLQASAAGSGAGFLAGGGPGAAIGGAAGMALPPLVEFGKNVATALQMTTGRALMKELLTQSKGVATPQVASILAAYARAVTENPELGQ